MKLNVKQSHVVRIGKFHSKTINDVLIGGKPVYYVDELKYLG